MPESSRLRTLVHLVRNILLAALLYLCTYQIIRLSASSSPVSFSSAGSNDPLGPRPDSPELIIPEASTSESTARIKLAGSGKTVTLNPHANVFNRPESAVAVKDDYMGARPHVDTEVDLDTIVEHCRGSYERLEKVNYVFKCIKFLAEGEDQYMSVPESVGDRASEQDPRQAEYRNADGQDNTRTRYVAESEAESPTPTSLGSCPGPIIPYHVYWTGPATWRVEIFIKSYLYTQNLACSRLWLWLDADRNPTAVADMLERDSIFAAFRPLVERGDITVREWRFPSRIPLPQHEDNTDGVGYYRTPGRPDVNGDSAVADGIVEDAHGQQWLVLTPKQMTFLPVAVSDAMRFVVLHLHGGVYFDMDVLMLRDMRPLVIPKQHSFAERWGAHPHAGDYNTAVMSLTANSSLSSYLLRGGVRMGLNFHPRVIGRMAWKDGRNHEFVLLETGLFDPIWTEFNWAREGKCTVPCLCDYDAVFKSRFATARAEWESYDGPELELIRSDGGDAAGSDESEHVAREVGGSRPSRHVRARGLDSVLSPKKSSFSLSSLSSSSSSSSSSPMQPIPKRPDSFSPTAEEEAELRHAGVVADYRLEQDKFPPTNRTLQHFFRGSYTYHIHNQVSRVFLVFLLLSPSFTARPPFETDDRCSGANTHSHPRGSPSSRAPTTASSPVGAPTRTARSGLGPPCGRTGSGWSMCSRPFRQQPLALIPTAHVPHSPTSITPFPARSRCGRQAVPASGERAEVLRRIRRLVLLGERLLYIPLVPLSLSPSIRP